MFHDFYPSHVDEIAVDQGDSFAFVQMTVYRDRVPHDTPTWERLIKAAMRTPEQYNVPEGHKYCINCGDVKHHSEFDRKASSKDRIHSWCKKCKREYEAKRIYEQREIERLRLQAEGKYRGPGRPRAA